jgi:hypothetical protein
MLINVLQSMVVTYFTSQRSKKKITMHTKLNYQAVLLKLLRIILDISEKLIRGQHMFGIQIFKVPHHSCHQYL